MVLQGIPPCCTLQILKAMSNLGDNLGLNKFLHTAMLTAVSHHPAASAASAARDKCLVCLYLCTIVLMHPAADLGTQN